MLGISAAQRTGSASLSKPASILNTEFDSRVLRVSTGFGGVTRPHFTQNGALAKVSCLHCGKDGGAVSASIPPMLRGDPGVIYVCDACDGTFGALPAHAIGFERYRQ